MGKSLISKDALKPFEMKFDQLSGDTITEARSVLMDGAKEIAEAGAAKLPRRTGEAASRVTYQKEDAFGNTVSIKSMSAQGYWLEWGVKDHEIRPQPSSNRKALKVGNAIFRRVQHPGFKARHWLRGAYKQVAPLLYARLEEILGVAIKKKV